jgi:RNA polymerase sigma-70 factor (sigma-E family)
VPGVTATATRGVPADVRAAADQRTGADAGITALFHAEHGRMLRLATVLLSDRASAEDVVQDAYASVYAAWDRIRDADAAVGYLHRSVVNGARSRLRRRVVAGRSRPEPLADAASAEDAALAELVGGPLAAAVRGLPRREREVVLLRHWMDLSERQTAEALGLRPGSVKAYGSRGLAALRAQLDSGTSAREEGR